MSTVEQGNGNGTPTVGPEVTLPTPKDKEEKKKKKKRLTPETGPQGKTLLSLFKDWLGLKQETKDAKDKAQTSGKEPTKDRRVKRLETQTQKAAQVVQEKVDEYEKDHPGTISVPLAQYKEETQEAKDKNTPLPLAKADREAIHATVLERETKGTPHEGLGQVYLSQVAEASQGLPNQTEITQILAEKAQIEAFDPQIAQAIEEKTPQVKTSEPEKPEEAPPPPEAEEEPATIHHLVEKLHSLKNQAASQPEKKKELQVQATEAEAQILSRIKAHEEKHPPQTKPIAEQISQFERLAQKAKASNTGVDIPATRSIASAAVSAETNMSQEDPEMAGVGEYVLYKVIEASQGVKNQDQVDKIIDDSTQKIPTLELPLPTEPSPPVEEEKKPEEPKVEEAPPEEPPPGEKEEEEPEEPEELPVKEVKVREQMAAITETAKHLEQTLADINQKLEEGLLTPKKAEELMKKAFEEADKQREKLVKDLVAAQPKYDYEASLPPENKIPHPKEMDPRHSGESQADFEARKKEWHEDYRQTIYSWFHKRLASLESMGGSFDKHPTHLTLAEAAIIRFQMAENLDYLHLDPSHAADQEQIAAYHKFSQELEKILGARQALQYVVTVWQQPEAGMNSLNAAAGFLDTDTIKTLFQYRTEYSETDTPTVPAMVAKEFRELQSLLNNNELDPIGHPGQLTPRIEIMNRLKELKWQKEEFQKAGQFTAATALDPEINLLNTTLEKGKERILKEIDRIDDPERKWAHQQALKLFGVLGEAARYNLPFLTGVGDFLVARNVRTDEWFDSEELSSIRNSAAIYRGLDFGYRAFMESDKFIGNLKANSRQELLNQLHQLGIEEQDVIITTELTETGNEKFKVDHLISLEDARLEDESFWKETDATGQVTDKNRFNQGAYSSNMFAAKSIESTRNFFASDFLLSPENLPKLLTEFQHLRGGVWVRERGQIKRRDARELKWKELIDRVLAWMNTKEGKEVYELTKWAPQAERQRYLQTAANMELVDKVYQEDLTKKYWGSNTRASIIKYADVYLMTLWRFPISRAATLTSWIGSTIGRIWKFMISGE